MLLRCRFSYAVTFRSVLLLLILKKQIIYKQLMLEFNSDCTLSFSIEPWAFNFFRRINDSAEPFKPLSTHTHTHTHIRTRTGTHARTHTHPHKHTHTRTLTRTHARAHARTHTHARIHTTHTRTHTRTHTTLHGTAPQSTEIM